MLHRNPITGRLAAALFAALLGIGAPAWSAPADDLKEAQKLYGQGKLQPALEKVEVFLRAQPRDPQGRFLKGLVLTEQKRIPDAIQIFTGLTEDFPELPEPYNNLAVLYASQGNYDKAKSALELAIHTHPSYATAHENLGDIYAQLASRAYDRALQLDKSNTTAQLKLAMVKELFAPQKAGTPRDRPDASKIEAPSAKAELSKAEPRKPPTSAAVGAPAKAGAQLPPSPSPVPPPTPSPSPAPTPAPAASSASSSSAKTQAIAAVESWAQAWSAKDVKGYLAAYAPEFEVPGGATRAAWEQERTERIQKPKAIEVTVKVLSAQADDKEATVKVRQSYKSDTLTSNNTKTLKLVRSGDRWLIKQERVGG